MIPIRDFPRYAITEDGHVFSYHSRKTLKASPRGGYLYVTLCRPGEKKKFAIHRLIASIVHPNPNGLPEVNHVDLNKFNNAPRNLEWVSRSGNQIHAHASGAYPTGEASRMCVKLRECDVREIRTLAGKLSQKKIGDLFGVSQTFVGKIIRNMKWKYLK